MATASARANPALAPGVYLITPRQLPILDTALWRALLRHCCAVQWRCERADITMAGDLRALCREFSRPFLVNNDPDLCLAVDADGVHLGRNDIAIARARQLLGADKIIGASCYQSLECAASAVAQGADYISFGACFSSPTKPEARIIDDRAILGQACGKFPRPVVAVGGIDCSNFTQILRTGARRLAVCAGVFAQTSPVSALSRIARHPLFDPKP